MVCFTFLGLGVRIWSLGLGFQGKSGLTVRGLQGLESRVKGLGFRI